MRRNGKRRKQLRLERLEARLLFARGDLIDHQFREDDFSIAGTYTYRLHEPEEFDYIDRIDNGTYSSSDGHVVWTSPKDGTGFFEGTALGDGFDTVDFGGRRPCSEYGIEDIGRFEFTLNAELSSMRIDWTEEISTRYTYYRDLTGGFCEQPDPPWSRFFGGLSRLYIGTFDAADHMASIRYEDDSPELIVDSPEAEVKWANTAATDMSLDATAYYEIPELPEGWEFISQSTEPPEDLEYVDIVNGGIEVTVDVTGRPLKTANVFEPVARIRMFWANSDSDFSGTEIPIDEGTEAVGVYWNSSQLLARVNEFPSAPSDANYIRVTIDASNGADSNSSNNSKFLRIGKFEAKNDQTGPLSEDGILNGLLGSVMHIADSSNPSVKAYAYKAETPLGAIVEIVDDSGAFTYDPTLAPLIQALAPGETINDAIEFMAIKDQTLIDDAVHIVSLVGMNDDPFAEFDEAETTNYQNITLQPSFLLANDWDIDNGDEVRLTNVDTMSNYGANVRLVWNDDFTEIESIIYEPATSETLRQINEGDEWIDSIGYEISDRHGGTAQGFVDILVTGEARRLGISDITTQLTTVNVPLWIPLSLDDPDGDPSDLQVSAVASNGSLVPPGGFHFDSTDASLTITPAPDATGRTTVTVTVQDNSGGSASTTFSLIVGTEQDLDLDGIPNEVEDAAPNGGDMNFDFEADSRQPNVASLPTHHGDAYVNVAVPPGQILESVFVKDSPAAAGDAANAQFPIGLVHFEVIVEDAGATSTVTFRSDFSDTPLNRYFQHDGGTEPESWKFLMHNKADGARVYEDRIEVVIRDGGRADQAAGQTNRIIGDAALASVEFPWQNIVREDIDNDGLIVPLDVLALINRINFVGPGQLGSKPSNFDFLPFFIDPSGGNSLEPIDALIVINYLNKQAAEGEGESVEPLLMPASPVSSTTSSCNSQVSQAVDAADENAFTNGFAAPVLASLADSLRKSNDDDRRDDDEYLDAVDWLLQEDEFWEQG